MKRFINILLVITILLTTITNANTVFAKNNVKKTYSLGIGQSIQLYSNEYECEDWSSTNSKVATVDEGYVTAKGFGECYIKYELEDDNYKCKYKINVNKAVRYSFVNKSRNMPKINGKKLNWKIKNKKIAKIKKNKLTGKKVGKTNVTLKYYTKSTDALLKNNFEQLNSIFSDNKKGSE